MPTVEENHRQQKEVVEEDLVSVGVRPMKIVNAETMVVTECPPSAIIVVTVPHDNFGDPSNLGNNLGCRGENFSAS